MCPLLELAPSPLRTGPKQRASGPSANSYPFSPCLVRTYRLLSIDALCAIRRRFSRCPHTSPSSSVPALTFGPEYCLQHVGVARSRQAGRTNVPSALKSKHERFRTLHSAGRTVLNAIETRETHLDRTPSCRIWLELHLLRSRLWPLRSRLLVTSDYGFQLSYLSRAIDRKSSAESAPSRRAVLKRRPRHRFHGSRFFRSEVSSTSTVCSSGVSPPLAARQEIRAEHLCKSSASSPSPSPRGSRADSSPYHAAMKALVIVIHTAPSEAASVKEQSGTSVMDTPAPLLVCTFPSVLIMFQLK